MDDVPSDLRAAVKDLNRQFENEMANAPIPDFDGNGVVSIVIDHVTHLVSLIDETYGAGWGIGALGELLDEVGRSLQHAGDHPPWALNYYHRGENYENAVADSDDT